MVAAFADENRCRRLLEAMAWPRGRVCPACGYKKSIAIADREMGPFRARPGLYQCSNGACRFQFTVTTRTPLHATKLPLSVWLKGLWFILQSDKGVSSPRLAEALGVSQPTAWRMGHALRLLVAAADPMEGVLEVDGFYFGGRRPRDPDRPSGRGGKGLPRTSKTPALAMVERPQSREPGAPAGRAGAAVIEDLSANEAERVLEAAAACEDTHLMTDEWKAFAPLGTAGFCAHDTVRHSRSEYARGIVHTNSAEGFNNRVRRTIAGVFHHISPKHADLYFHEIGFRWSQRVVAGQTVRRSRKGRETAQTVWTRLAPALQLPAVLAHAVGRQMRRTKDGGISIQSSIAVFG